MQKSFKIMVQLKFFVVFFFTYSMYKFSLEYSVSCKKLHISRYQIQHYCLLVSSAY